MGIARTFAQATTADTSLIGDDAANTPIIFSTMWVKERVVNAKINKPAHLSEIVVHYTSSLVFSIFLCAFVSVALFNVLNEPHGMPRAQTNNTALASWAVTVVFFLCFCSAALYAYSTRVRSINREIHISRFFITRRPQTIESISEISEVQGRRGMGLRLGFKDGSRIALTAAAKNLEAFRKRVKSG